MRTQVEQVPDGADCCGTPVTGALSESDAADLAAGFAALADPVRLRLFSLVAAAGEICSCDLQGPLDRSQPTVSHHTKVLSEAGLITGERRGRWVYWRVAPDRLDPLRRLLDEPHA
ncbi:MAG TPA: metalloregulator ArsR/SmtB family transcription factor [Acidimicrobiales bacterium]|jgi:ArsR family transcriptional regulator|nr:metalloregulator ArsR/SmtB family transcription factor [Acidimicrobiales bacterium]